MHASMRDLFHIRKIRHLFHTKLDCDFFTFQLDVPWVFDFEQMSPAFINAHKKIANNCHLNGRLWQSVKFFVNMNIMAKMVS
jgi:hypothetical protein